VGPVLGLLLPWIGTTGNVAFGAACMISYSLGMGLLFWVVGTFAVGLPKSGRWMEWVKSIFGLVMIGSALYFVRAWLPGFERITKSDGILYGASFCVLAGLLLGAVQLSFSAGSLTRTRKALGIAFTTVGIVLFVGYLDAKPVHVGWEHDLLVARSKAKAHAAPLLIDFGANWCQACGELDRHTFSDARVIAEAERFIKVKIDLSPGKQVEVGREWLKTYGARGLPLVVLHDSAGQEQTRITEFVEADEMLELLRAVN
jgi:thioredoxin:protein disulfide reductase